MYFNLTSLARETDVQLDWRLPVPVPATPDNSNHTDVIAVMHFTKNTQVLRMDLLRNDWTMVLDAVLKHTPTLLLPSSSPSHVLSLFPWHGVKHGGTPL